MFTLLHSERPKLHTNLAFMSAVGLINDNLLVMKNYFDLTLYRTKMKECCNAFLWTIMRRRSTEVHVDIRHHQGAKYTHWDIMIYHKFSHAVTFYRLNRKTLISCQNSCCQEIYTVTVKLPDAVNF